MRTRTTGFAALIIAGLSVTLCHAVDVSTAAATNAAVVQPAGVMSHSVVKGDTLWGISAKYYGTPWVWDRLWQANKAQNPDPNRIYPGQQLTIPERSALPPKAVDAVPAAAPQQIAAVPETKPAEEKAAEPITVEPVAAAPGEDLTVSPVVEPAEPVTEKPVEVAAKPVEMPAATPAAQAEKKYRSGDSMIVSSDWEVDGFIVGEKDKKLLISEGDTVYVKIERWRVKPGTQMTVYRRLNRVADPEVKNASLGFEVRRVGRLEISTDIGDQSSTAKVVMSSEPIETGDVVKINQ